MKVALITGGSRGIGLATALEMGKAGYRVAIVATREEALYRESTQKLKGAGIRYSWHVGNIAAGEDRTRVVHEVVDQYARIDVLVNNAGVAPKERNDLLEMTEESFDYVLGINARGNMFMTQAVARQMIRQEAVEATRGVIVNVSSCSAVVSSVNRGEYCVSKAAVAMLTKLYADRLAAEGIRVYEVRPGIIKTDMTAGVTDKYDRMLAQGAFPIARWGAPEDVARAVRAFCSQDFAYTTGSFIDVDGGFHIQRI